MRPGGPSQREHRQKGRRAAPTSGVFSHKAGTHSHHPYYGPLLGWAGSLLLSLHCKVFECLGVHFTRPPWYRREGRPWDGPARRTPRALTI